jgi:hypothetical protein
MEAKGKVDNRFLRTYAVRCDTPMSLRRGGKQVVPVEHVYRDRQKPEGVQKKERPNRADLMDAFWLSRRFWSRP